MSETARVRIVSTQKRTGVDIPVYISSDPEPVGIVHFEPPVYPMVFEVMTPNSGTKKAARRWKSFQHYKRWTDIPLAGLPGVIPFEFRWGNFVPLFGVWTELSDAVIASSFGENGSFNLGLPSLFDQVAYDSNEPGWWDDFIPDPAGLDQLIIRSLGFMSPSIRPSLSLINEIIELKDIVTLKHTVKRFKSFGALLFRQNPLKTFRDLAGVASDVYLQLEFNIKQFIRDIKGARKALAQTAVRIRALVNSEGRPRVARFKLQFDEFSASDDPGHVPLTSLVEPTFATPLTQGSVHATYNWYCSHCTRQVTHSKSLFTAQMRYSVNYTDFQKKHAEVLAMLDAFGVNFNPEIIWDAIPWSFVVDWFVKIGDLLSELKVGLSDPALNIMDYSWAIRRERVITVRGNFIPLDGSGDWPPYRISYVRVPDVRETSYKRVAGLPDPSLLQLSGLNLYKVSLASALVISRLTGPRSKTRGHRRRIQRRTVRKKRAS